ncbi:hypothetical protein BN14_07133 [Rhizoctonia solani AG-1 IB]|uniref:Uncharacterized protein n=1 Tax=Thanatephorus cucumeris (strain AG1-IB / isolate 7/3/14) TaxID=1108050 RepID=M5C0Z7_THACB|nr:hypothetical protein BN14_07133 [Rhizoctonia solani AG-1 IB]
MSDSLDNHQNGKRLTVRVGSMVVLPDGERRMTRGAARRTSGSDYGLEATNNTASVSPPATRRSARGTRTPEAKPRLDDDEDDEDADHIHRMTRSGRAIKAVSYLDPSSDQSDDPHPPRTRTRRTHVPNDFIAADDDEEELGEEDYGARRLRPRPKPQKPRRQPPPQPSIRDEMRPRPPRQTRNSARAAIHDEDPDYSDGQHDSHDDDDMDLDVDAEGEDEEEEEEHEGEHDSKPRGYSLRQRRQVNYTIPQLLDVADNERHRA